MVLLWFYNGSIMVLLWFKIPPHGYLHIKKKKETHVVSWKKYKYY